MKKRTHISLWLTLALVCLCAAVFAPAAGAEGALWYGSGTEEDPWLIATGDDLLRLRDYTAAGNETYGKHFRLDCDINLESYCDSSSGWVPIGLSENLAFRGVFDGAGHTIRKLFFDRKESYNGLFGYVRTGGTIKNLTVEGSVNGGRITGGIVGISFGKTENCRFTGSVRCTYTDIYDPGCIGGIIGCSREGAVVIGCTVSADISAKIGYTGGVLGFTNGTVSGCSFTGTVSNTSNGGTGGISGGLNSYSSMTDCSAEGEVNGYGHVGGIVGYCSDRISNCRFTGSVSSDGTEYAGRIAGYCSQYASVSGCSAEAEVTSGHKYTGGIAGQSRGPVSNCSFSGKVTGSDRTGGIAGFAAEYVTGCVFDGDVSGGIQVGGIVGFLSIGNDSSTYIHGSNCPPDFHAAIKNCEARGTVKADSGTGGIAGEVYSEVSDCQNYCSVTGYDCTGGIVGTNAVEIWNNVNHGNVRGNSYVGGISGRSWNDGGAINNCTNYGKVTGRAVIGGIVGRADSNYIFKGINHGNVACEDEYAGGIAGGFGEPSYSYGLYGIDPDFIECMNDGEVNGHADSPTPIGYHYNSTVFACYPNGMQGMSVISSTKDRNPCIPDRIYHDPDYVFYFWNSEADGSGNFYTPGATASHGGCYHLYAFAMKEETVSYTGGERKVRVTEGRYRVLPEGWYILKESASIDQPVSVIGDVNLILADGITLNAGAGVSVPEGSSLSVWGQSAGAGAGTLNASGAENCAAIGGGSEGAPHGPITVHSGNVTATGGSHAAGIGGSRSVPGGSLTVNGGTVTALGGMYGAGIGGGDEGGGGSVTVNGGSVVARGAEGAAGIGGGDYGSGGSLLVNGGTVAAYGSVRSKTGQASAGIGAGRPHNDGSEPLDGGSCRVFSGTVTAVPGTAASSASGAQAIGVSFSDAAAGKGASIEFRKGLRVLEADAAEPAVLADREDACRRGAVVISPCDRDTHRNAGDFYCKYCDLHMEISDYLEPSDEPDTYLIRSSGDWEALAFMVNRAWLSRPGTVYLLTDDIAVTSMVGTVDCSFSGVFNGRGHTLSFSCTTGASGIAPFRYVRDAAFEHLRVAGTINTGGKEAAGLASNVTGSCAVTDCVSDVMIRDISPYSLNRGGHAGFVSRCGGGLVSVTGSMFTGSITGEHAANCAGFLGAGGDTVSYCVYNGTMNTKGESSDFIRDSDYSNSCFTFSTAGIDHVRGMLPFTLSAGEGVSLDVGPGTAYGVSGITAYPLGLGFNGVYYAGEGQDLVLRLSSNPEEGYAARYSASQGELVRGFGVWLLSMPAANTVISAEYIPIRGFGTPDLVLPAAVKTVENEAFEGIPARVVYVHDGCVSIGDHAFRNCVSLSQIRIPDLCVIGADAFEGVGRVYIYGTALSPAQDYCDSHENCVFVDELQN